MVNIPNNNLNKRYSNRGFFIHSVFSKQSLEKKKNYGKSKHDMKTVFLEWPVAECFSTIQIRLSRS